MNMPTRLRSNERLSKLMSRIGRTPTLVLESERMTLIKGTEIRSISAPVRIPGNNRVVLKLEHLRRFNPTGSAYDRLYPHLIRDLELRGTIHAATPLIECSVGNAGAAFAWACRELGYSNYSVILPTDIYSARIRTVRDLGAKIIFSPPDVGPAGYVQLIEDLAFKRPQGDRNVPDRTIPVSKIARTPVAPYSRLADEVLSSLAAAGVPTVDTFVFGVGSGNTISGVGAAVKERNTGTKVVCAEFIERPYVKVIKEGRTPPIGGTWIDTAYIAGTIHGVTPDKLNLDVAVIDDVMVFGREDRDEALDVLNATLGLRAGRTSALAWAAVWEMTRRVTDQTILTIIFDDLAKYELFAPPAYDVFLDSGALRVSALTPPEDPSVIRPLKWGSERAGFSPGTAVRGRSGGEQAFDAIDGSLALKGHKSASPTL